LHSFLQYREFYKLYFQLFSITLSVARIQGQSSCRNIISYYYTTAKYLKKIVGSNTKNIVLAHLSETNNTKELAYNTVKEQIDDDINVIIANQDTGTELIEV